MNIRQLCTAAVMACAALTVTSISASAVTVNTVTTNDYSSIVLADTVVLPDFSYWDPAPSTRSGNSSGVYRSPFDENSADAYFNSDGIAESTEYFAVGPGNPSNPAILKFTQDRTSFAFLWGSPDAFNTLTFRLDGSDVGTFNGGAFTPLAFGSSYVTFSGLFDEVEFYSDPSNAFEFAAMTATPVPLPASALLLIAGVGGLGAMRRFGRKAA